MYDTNSVILLVFVLTAGTDSFLMVDPVTNHAPNQKIMAKQWFQAYQLGPKWVPPLLMPGTLSNVVLAYSAQTVLQRYLYILAAIGVFSIAPITFLYMEPGINGACKWRAQMLLKDEKFILPETGIWHPLAHGQGGTDKMRRWAEGSDMKTLVLAWRRINDVRWVIGGIAAVLSGLATFSH